MEMLGLILACVAVLVFIEHQSTAMQRLQRARAERKRGRRKSR